MTAIPYVTPLNSAVEAVVRATDPVRLFSQLQHYDRGLLAAGALLRKKAGCPPGIAVCVGNCPLCWRGQLLENPEGTVAL
ncbi:MAG: hypothetical protein C4551_06555 [Bacillota bacterium]|jgi:hypothetical protein|nr:MAG: hypothetical protein C4551_06555 [Bacillota bacterium]